jgi:hypothetical protein
MFDSPLLTNGTCEMDHERRKTNPTYDNTVSIFLALVSVTDVHSAIVANVADEIPLIKKILQRIFAHVRQEQTEEISPDNIN